MVGCGTRQVAGRAQCHCRARSQSATAERSIGRAAMGALTHIGDKRFRVAQKKVCKKEVDGVQSSGCCGVGNASFRRKTDVGGMKEKTRGRLAAEVARKTKGGRHKNTGLAAQQRSSAQQHTPHQHHRLFSLRYHCSLPAALPPPTPVNVAPGLSCLALGLLFVLGAPLSPNLLIATGFPFQL